MLLIVTLCTGATLALLSLLDSVLLDGVAEVLSAAQGTSGVLLALRPAALLVMNLVLRSQTAPAELKERVRSVLLRLDPSQPAHSFFAMTDLL